MDADQSESGSLRKPVPTCLVFRFVVDPNLRARIASGEYPRVGFIELRDRLHSQVVDLSLVEQSRVWRVVVCRLFSATLALAVLAWTWRRQFGLFYVGDDTTGVLLAALLKFSRTKPRLAIVNHHLSHRWKSLLFRFGRLASPTDALICLNEFQAHFARTTLKLPEDRVFSIPWGADVDAAFFSPPAAERHEMRYVLSVGLEARDYDTLVRALDGLDIPTTIVDSGVRHKGNYSAHIPQSSGTLRVSSDLNYRELRDAYAGCAFVVLPVHDTAYPAGITCILEAMLMGKPVLATRSRGIREYIQDGQTGIWANIADPSDLQQKILYLWNNPTIAERMGANGRTWARQRLDVARYADEMVRILTRLSKEDLSSPSCREPESAPQARMAITPPRST